MDGDKPAAAKLTPSVMRSLGFGVRDNLCLQALWPDSNFSMSKCCGATESAMSCTRSPGHAGPHAAYSGGTRVLYGVWWDDEWEEI